MKCRVSIQSEDFDIASEISCLSDGLSNTGAVVSFTGLCRDEGGKLAALELEHYPGMAEKKAQAIAEEALQRWSLDGVTVIHRHGLIRPGEQIVLVLTASAHRQSAFAAAEFLMDYLKTKAPFWKREHLRDGTTGGWVEARDEDDAALEKWQQTGSGHTA